RAECHFALALAPPRISRVARKPGPDALSQLFLGERLRGHLDVLGGRDRKPRLPLLRWSERSRTPRLVAANATCPRGTAGAEDAVASALPVQHTAVDFRAGA